MRCFEWTITARIFYRKLATAFFFLLFFFCVFTLIIFNYDLTEAWVCLEDAKSLLERKNKNICLVKLENDKPEDSLTSFKTPIDNQFDACVYVLMIIEKNKGCNLPLEKKCKFHTQANIIMVYSFIKTKSLGLFELKYVHLVNEFRERIRNGVENNTQNCLYKQYVFPAPQRSAKIWIFST